MRPPNSTLPAPQVYRCAASILQDHLELRDHGPKCRADLLLTLLFYAAARITSLSDACKSLRDAPSDEAARLALIATQPDFVELQRRLLLRPLQVSGFSSDSGGTVCWLMTLVTPTVMRADSASFS